MTQKANNSANMVPSAHNSFSALSSLQEDQDTDTITQPKGPVTLAEAHHKEATTQAQRHESSKRKESSTCTSNYRETDDINELAIVPFVLPSENVDISQDSRLDRAIVLYRDTPPEAPPPQASKRQKTSSTNNFDLNQAPGGQTSDSTLLKQALTTFQEACVTNTMDGTALNGPTMALTPAQTPY